ncbi:MAG: RNA-binding cell elongation regulator Jag/EloR [Endomicrobiia bacterium]
MSKEKSKSKMHNSHDSSKESGIEVEGKTVEDAIQKGLEILGLPKDKVEIKILDEGESGLFGLMGSKPAKIRLKPKQPSITSTGLSKEIENFLKSYITKLVELMGIKNKYELKFRTEENTFQLNLNFSDEKIGSFLIGKNGRVLQSLNNIIRATLINKYKTTIEKFPNINIDVNNYFLKQEEKIKDILNKAIKIVRKTKKPYALNSMSPKLRKFVHLFFKDSKEFETVSEGEGPHRRVVIKPKE